MPTDQPRGFAATCPVPADLALTPVVAGDPAPGRRVRVHLPGRGPGLYHVLRLPDDWHPGRRWPVLCEYPGNGPYHDARGDLSTGYQEDACVGFGLGGARGFITAVLPCADPRSGAHAREWWGDPEAATAYCRAAVADTVARFAGDPGRLVLCGFSRGAIACSYLGLRDDATAGLWRGLFGTSHWDGARRWPHADSDPASAAARLRRLAGRPLYACHERSPDGAAIRACLAGGAATVVDLPWPNHTQEWLLRDLPERRAARIWLSQVIA